MEWVLFPLYSQAEKEYNGSKFGALPRGEAGKGGDAVFATVVNVVLVVLGSVLGLLFKNWIRPRSMEAVTAVLGLCVAGIGISGMVAAEDMLCVIVCLVLGTVLGEAVNIELRLERLGDWVRERLIRDGSSRFTEGFVTASLLYCVGAMAITGSIEAGLHGSYATLLSKGVIDGVTAISFAATMGIGVAFSALPILLYQGGITLLAAQVGPWLSPAVINGMSSVGGVLILALALNLLELSPRRLRVGNMLPAIFLPALYVPLAQWLSGGL